MPIIHSKESKSMQSKRSLTLCADLGALMNMAAAPGVQAMQTPDDVTRKEIQALREQVEALQRRLDAQAAIESAAQQAAAAKAQVATVPAQIHAQLQTAVDGAKPKTDKIYFKGVTITPGGFVEGAAVYRSRDTNNDITTGFNSIPYNNSSMGQTSQFVFTPRQSRVQALVEGDPNADTHLKFYAELDFQGAAQTANSKETNSYNPRLRHLFGSVDGDDLGLHFLSG